MSLGSLWLPSLSSFITVVVDGDEGNLKEISVIVFMVAWLYAIVFAVVRALIFLLFVILSLLSLLVLGLIYFPWTEAWFEAVQLDSHRLYRWVRWGRWDVKYSRIVESDPHFSFWRLLDKGYC